MPKLRHAEESRQALAEIVTATGWTPAQVREEALWALHAEVLSPCRTSYTPCAERTPAPASCCSGEFFHTTACARRDPSLRATRKA